MSPKAAATSKSTQNQFGTDLSNYVCGVAKTKCYFGSAENAALPGPALDKDSLTHSVTLLSSPKANMSLSLIRASLHKT